MSVNRAFAAPLLVAQTGPFKENLLGFLVRPISKKPRMDTDAHG